MHILFTFFVCFLIPSEADEFSRRLQGLRSWTDLINSAPLRSASDREKVFKLLRKQGEELPPFPRIRWQDQTLYVNSETFRPLAHQGIHSLLWRKQMAVHRPELSFSENLREALQTFLGKNQLDASFRFSTPGRWWFLSSLFLSMSYADGFRVAQLGDVLSGAAVWLQNWNIMTPSQTRSQRVVEIGLIEVRCSDLEGGKKTFSYANIVEPRPPKDALWNAFEFCKVSNVQTPSTEECYRQATNKVFANISEATARRIRVGTDGTLFTVPLARQGTQFNEESSPKICEKEELEIICAPIAKRLQAYCTNPSSRDGQEINRIMEINKARYTNTKFLYSEPDPATVPPVSPPAVVQ